MMYMNRRDVVKGLTAILAGGVIAANADAARYAMFGNVAEGDSTGSLAVMTYNIRTSSLDKDTDNSWVARRDALAELVERENPDVIGFQEVMPDQSEWLQKRLPQYAFVGEHRNANRKSGEASPVAFRKSRFAAKSGGTFWLSETPDVPGSKSWKTAPPKNFCPRPAAFWYPAASAPAACRARSGPSNTPEHTASPSSASAWVCSAQSLSMPAMS